MPRADYFAGDTDAAPLIAGINVTPLVDITLVLLIIFMVTASYIVSPSIKIDLPKAGTGGEQQRTALALTLTARGALFLNGTPSNDDALGRYVAGVLPANPDLQAVIGADQAVPHGTVVHLIDVVRRAGVRRFAINVDPGGRQHAPTGVQ
ncbi:MAG TPA: biopolymer transporter ExbD [Polyangia bacterium]|nr:biopolymer transporter ExbD [Polyangia bacterium]